MKIRHFWTVTYLLCCSLAEAISLLQNTCFSHDSNIQLHVTCNTCVTGLTGMWLSINIPGLISSVVRALAQKARGSGFESWLTWLFTTCYTCMEMHYVRHVPCVVAMLRPGFLLCRVPSFLHDGPKAGPAWVGGRWGPRGGWAVGDHQTPHPLNHILLQGPGTQQQGLRSAVWDRHL